MRPTIADTGYLIGQSVRWLRALLDEPSYRILAAAKDAGEAGVSTGDLAARAGVGSDEAARTVEWLVRDGWVTVKADPADRGSRLVRVTPKTTAALPVLNDAAHWSVDRARAGFSDSEMTQLLSLLERMQENLR